MYIVEACTKAFMPNHSHCIAWGNATCCVALLACYPHLWEHAENSKTCNGCHIIDSVGDQDDMHIVGHVHVPIGLANQLALLACMPHGMCQDPL